MKLMKGKRNQFELNEIERRLADNLRDKLATLIFLDLPRIHAQIVLETNAYSKQACCVLNRQQEPEKLRSMK